jgi:hypothetical protein
MSAASGYNLRRSHSQRYARSSTSSATTSWIDSAGDSRISGIGAGSKERPSLAAGYPRRAAKHTAPQLAKKYAVVRPQEQHGHARTASIGGRGPHSAWLSRDPRFDGSTRHRAFQPGEARSMRCTRSGSCAMRGVSLPSFDTLTTLPSARIPAVVVVLLVIVLPVGRKMAR